MNDSMRSQQTPGEPAPPEEPGRVGVDRRRFLIASGAVLGSGLVAARLGVDQVAMAHDGAALALPIWAATRHEDRYLALAGSGESPEIRELTAAPDGALAIGPARAALPAGITALALHSAGSRLLVAGAASFQTGGVASLRPVLYDVTGAQARELPLVTDPAAGFGVATAMAATSARHLAVAIEGADDAEQQYNAITRIATSVDAGRTWSVSTLAEGLGEGFPSHLTSAGERLFAVTVDAAGKRQGHEGAVLGGPWRQVPADPAEGSLLAVLYRRGAGYELIDRSPEGAVRRFRRQPGETAWQATGTVEIGQPIRAVTPVSGAGGEFIAIGESRAHLVGDA